MDIQKELEEVQKKVDELKRKQDNIEKIKELQERHEKRRGIRPFSHAYEMT
jgi:uncharacterized membrane protein (DUF106 family)